MSMWRNAGTFKIVFPDSGKMELNLLYNIPCELFTTLCIYCFKQTLHVSDTVKTI